MPELFLFFKNFRNRFAYPSSAAILCDCFSKPLNYEPT
ncbi:hypothetical protein LEP1GSC192_1437 [Leptospira sp. B5-022]|nr:hypothetical protein LEP1GSC192_1437 [Leptospira sp. B5-022]